jgi:cobalt-zinc-cadmium efflux system outer membrane protein
MFPLSAKQWGFTLSAPLDVLLLRPHRIAAAQLRSQRVAERLVQDGLDVMRDIRTAYVDLAQAENEQHLAKEGSALRDEIARIAEGRLDAGAIAELDVSAMRLDALFGKDEVIQAGRKADLAREELRFQLGAQLTDVEIAIAQLTDVPPMEFDVEELVAEALASRPDLRAVQMGVEAAMRAAQLTRFNYLNVWAVLPDINSDGDKGFEAGPGLKFNLPIFNQNQAAKALAAATVEKQMRQYVKLRDSVVLEVRRAYTQLDSARREQQIWREQVLPQAEVAARAEQMALEEDGVSLLLVLETTRQLLNARSRELQASADIHRAVAELERSVGRRLLDAAHQDDVGELDLVGWGESSHHGPRDVQARHAERDGNFVEEMP